MQVIKRSGEMVAFDKVKIEVAIIKAMKYGVGYIEEGVAKYIANSIEIFFETLDSTPTIYDIENLVFKSLIEHGLSDVARAYEGYRAIQQFKRETNTTDESIMGLINATNVEVLKENSNKDDRLASTQRDLIAGEVSKDIARRKVIPTHIVQAHDEGILHWHDLDYAIQKIHNCDLIDIKDMLDNGTVINKRMIESPKSFQVACTVMTQIIAQVASSQFGGQSLAIKHLGKYLKKSEEKYYATLKDIITDTNELNTTVSTLLQKELEAGIQTIQYQINTLLTTNGQSPFVTLFLELDEKDEYIEYTARIIDEIIKQRIQGIKNEKGVYTTPSFPKLVYVLDHHNCLEGGKYDYITESACVCTSKRMYPDYISAKEMRKIHEGNVYSPMGCRSFLGEWLDKDGYFKYEGRFNIGVISINLPQIAILAKGDKDKFWAILDQRLELCKEALLCRYELLKGTVSDVAPILWRYGGLARLESGETIDKLLENGYASISLGYIGVYEAVKLITGSTHTKEKEFAVQIVKRLREACDTWKKETGLGFGLYGTPSEGLCNRFCKIDKTRFGVIKDVTDKGYYTNSYHVDVREEIDAFSKLEFEAQFHPISAGGAISYVEMPNMSKNIEAIKQLVNYIYHNIQYAEFNTKCDCCHECNYEGEMVLNEAYEWYCPNCKNSNPNKMNIVRRTCGYLGENGWNIGKTKEISQRVLHLN